MQSNPGIALIRFLLLDVVLDVVRFPVWWYTSGLRRVGRWYGSSVWYGAQRLGIPTLARSLGKPMYGQRDWQSRLISVAVRFFQLIILFILFLFILLWHTTLFLAYFFTLPAIVTLIILSFPNPFPHV